MEKTPTLNDIIDAQTKGMKPEEVHDLDCSGSMVDNLGDVFDKFTNLEALNLFGAGLSSLSGFPSLPNLLELDLSDNKISGGFEALESCPKLVALNLSGNPIKDISAIAPLACLGRLQSLELSDCEVTKTEGYQSTVFDIIQSLTSLDGLNRNNEPLEEEFDCSDDEDGSDSEDEDGSDSEDEKDGEDVFCLSYLPGILQKSDLGDEDSKDYGAPESADDDDDDDDEDEDDASDEENIEEEEAKQTEVEETDYEELRRGRKRKQEATDEESTQN